ncbi:TMV resistance protein N-like [Neltuma alba]|uniref:TMV resistance protein N-like n=1 Tax=Neltuma alba TaxID=207710 RepID=UPI0010A3B2CF|nr:TMV resistance protein N-like [Prosopis alba]XP_028755601.1 TMV resistance protein N-like [Prosopis alba]XP_028755602.1 TMV resistance protein N-like [Prosopis alba]XP_028755603.1 TMV resistance protein N-like [Prosopis alba]
MVCDSSPSSFHDSQIKDVFISFSGEDTRRIFVCHLLEELRRVKIKPFVDEDIERGEHIPSSLLRAIQESRISIVVFSKHYASSSWCLDELEKIIDCKNVNKQIVLPVFYDIRPSDVRHQKGAYQKAFARHELKYQGNDLKVRNWRSALKNAADISGYVSSDFNNDSELIKKIVNDVSLRLNDNHSSPSESEGLVGTDQHDVSLRVNDIHPSPSESEGLVGTDQHDVSLRLNDIHPSPNESEGIVGIDQHDVSLRLNDIHPSPSESKGLVGIDQHVARIRSFLEMESKEVQILGICGMSGMGKTTIAQVAYDEFSSHYEGCCFLHNVREESEKHGLKYLSNKLISELQGEKSIPVQEKPISERKVFVVLDDVGTLEQLKHLVTEGICWGSGSRVIVTSKDKQALDTRGGLPHKMHEVKELDSEESLKLFSLNAFKKSHPEREYEGLSKRLVAYAKGLPLVLKVLGLHLCSKDMEAWENTLRKLEKHPSPPIRDVLRISYDGLDGGRRQIFLDITYFFERKREDQVMSLHYANGIFGDCGIKGLLNKGLISVSNDNMIRMPDMIQEMGWEIVCKEWNKNTEQRWHWQKLVLQYDLVRSIDPAVLFGTEYRPVVTED